MSANLTGVSVQRLKPGDVVVFESDDPTRYVGWTLSTMHIAWHADTRVMFVIPDTRQTMFVLDEFRPMSRFRRFFNQNAIETVKVVFVDGTKCFVSAKSLIKIASVARVD